MLGEVAKWHLEEDKDSDDGEGKAHLGSEHHLARIGSSELPALEGEAMEAFPGGGGPVGEAPEATARRWEGVIVEIGEEGRREEPLLAPLLEGVMEGSELGSGRQTI